MLDEQKRRMLMGLMLVLFVCVAAIQHWVEPTQRQFQESKLEAESGELMVQLPGQFIIASVTGFKEVVAGALWIRADHFFHMGQYQAIVPLVRLVTWLDSHNLDVYTTGAWHLDYNFVDENQMSDKRYIPPAIALLKEGIKNNPNIWDLYFELGWTHYNKKLNDSTNALKYIKMACDLDGFDINTGKKVPRPEFVDRMLAHQYEKLGMFDEAIKQWKESRLRVVKMLENPKLASTNYVDNTSLDICDRNLSLLYLRMGWRYGDMEKYKLGVDIMQRMAARKDAPRDLVMAAAASKADYERRLASNNPPKDALRPLDLGFSVEFKKVKPKVFVISGKINLVNSAEYMGLASESATNWYSTNLRAAAERREVWRDGSRVYWMLTDYDYAMPEIDKFDWKIDTSKTVVWDSIYVSGGGFSQEINLSINDEFYPFTKDKYKLVVWVNPEQPGCPDYIQDRIGWRGEAFYDARYLDTKTRPGFKMLRYEKVLDRSDIL